VGHSNSFLHLACGHPPSKFLWKTTTSRSPATAPLGGGPAFRFRLTGPSRQDTTPVSQRRLTERFAVPCPCPLLRTRAGLLVGVLMPKGLTRSTGKVTCTLSRSACYRRLPLFPSRSLQESLVKDSGRRTSPLPIFPAGYVVMREHITARHRLHEKRFGFVRINPWMILSTTFKSKTPPFPLRRTGRPTFPNKGRLPVTRRCLPITGFAKAAALLDTHV